MRLTLIGPTLGMAAVVAACSSSPTAPSAHRLTGQVQAITPPTLSVGGQIVTTTGATVVRRGGARIALQGLHLGEPVRVQGEQEANDTLAASEIDADENEVEFHGTVDSIVAPKLWVNGRTVVTDSTTRIRHGEDTPITLADLTVGDTVKVEGAVQADSSVLAHRIEVGSEREDEDEEHDASVELHGAIDSIMAPNLFVRGRTVVTDSATVFLRGDQHIVFGDLQVADTVEVEGTFQADSSLQARKVKLVTREGDGEP